MNNSGIQQDQLKLMNKNNITNGDFDFKSIYYPGKLIILVNELFNKQKDPDKVSF